MPHANEKESIKVVGYIRVSSIDSAREGVSLQVQEEAIRRYASLYKYELVQIYRDEGISGAKTSRPGLDSLRTAAREGDFDKVIFKKLSRLGRNAMDLLSLYKEFEDDCKIELISIDEGIKTTTSIGRLLRNVLAAIAEFERDTINVRMVEAKRMKVKNHEIYNGCVPYGYRFDKNTGKVIINKKEKAIYLKVVDFYLNHDMSLSHITGHLNKLRIKTRYGKKWHNTSLSYILRNEAYMGKKVLNKYKYQRVGNYSAKMKIRKGHRAIPVLKPKSENIVFPFPKFIDESVWNQIQRKLKLKIRPTKGTQRHIKFFVAGMARCGCCGSKISAITSHRRKEITRDLSYYICYWSKTYNIKRNLYKKELCTLPNIKMEFVDDFIWSEIASILSYPDKPFLDFIDNKEIRGSLIKKREDMKVESNDLECQIDKYIEQIGDISDQSIMFLIMKKLHILGRKLSDVKNSLETNKKYIDTLDKTKMLLKRPEYFNFRESLSKCIASIPYSEKKHIIRTLISLGDCDRAPVILHQMPLKDTQLTCEHTPYNSLEEDGILIDLYFNLRMDRVLSIIDYLRGKGYLDRHHSTDNLNTVDITNILVPIKATHHVKRPLLKMQSKTKSK